MFYISPTLQVLKFFKIAMTDCDDTNNVANNTKKGGNKENDDTNNNNANIEEGHKENNAPVIGKGNRNAILSLIELFKENYHNFKNTSMKNDTVWTKIMNEMNKRGYKYTKMQVENKFKYLKQRYTKKKDNMGNKNTGESPILFDYFEEFDEIFGSKPSIKPLAIASSSTLQINVPDNSIDEDEEDEPERKQIKRSRLGKDLEGWKEHFAAKDAEKETARERRHRDKMEIAQQAISSNEKLMAKLIDKL